MNHVVTIPKRVAEQGELVLIPRREYERLVRMKERASWKRGLDRELDVSLEELRQGKVVGPFDTVDELMKSLKGKRKHA